MKKLFIVLMFSAACILCRAGEFKPTATVKFAQKDTSALYFDYYAPNDSAAFYADGSRKPVIMFAFGGGFRSGCRNDRYFMPWIRKMVSAGFGVVSIDYRLGMVGFKFNVFKLVDITDYAIRIAVEDMYSATAWLLENGALLGIDPYNIVISGSSAGAITALQAEYELANGSEIASVLPQDFRYAGVMAFAGSIFSRNGKLKYQTEPCPQLLLHGEDDKILNRKKLQLFNLCFAGSESIAETLRESGFVYTYYCYAGHMHEISGAMSYTIPEQLRFLEESVRDESRRSMSATVYDLSIPIPEWAKKGVKSLY